MYSYLREILTMGTSSSYFDHHSYKLRSSFAREACCQSICGMRFFKGIRILASFKELVNPIGGIIPPGIG